MGTSLSTSARLLVVEDDPNLHDLIVKVARRSGHEPISAYTGEQALSILRNEPEKVDWLLTDIRLSGVIDGWVVGSEFTLNYPLRPVIYMSGMEEDCARRRSVGSIFLRKPVNVSELMATFARLGEDVRASLAPNLLEPRLLPFGQAAFFRGVRACGKSGAEGYLSALTT